MCPSFSYGLNETFLGSIGLTQEDYKAGDWRGNSSEEAREVFRRSTFSIETGWQIPWPDFGLVLYCSSSGNQLQVDDWRENLLQGGESEEHHGLRAVHDDPGKVLRDSDEVLRRGSSRGLGGVPHEGPGLHLRQHARPDYQRGLQV